MSDRAARPGPSLKARALRYLSRREHSRTELARKLAVYEPCERVVEEVLDALQAQGWLSDERFAEGVVRSRASRYGSLRLRADLRAKGVDEDLIHDALRLAQEDEPERARQWWVKKFGAAPRTPQERARQFRDLLARGFSAEVVRRTIPDVEEQASID